MRTKSAKLIVSIAAVIDLLLVAPAWSKEPAYGWITSVNGRQVVLNGARKYELAASIDKESVRQNEFVLLLFDNSGEVNRVEPLPRSWGGPSPVTESRGTPAPLAGS